MRAILSLPKPLPLASVSLGALTDGLAAERPALSARPGEAREPCPRRGLTYAYKQGTMMNAPDANGAKRTALRTLASGFLQGVGAIIALCIALGIAVVIARHWYIEPGSDFSAKDIVLSGVEEQKRDGVTWIIGTAKNSGKRPTRSIEVQANLFEHGMFVDQYSTYIHGINPGQSKYFKIAFGCKDSAPVDHDGFKVQVVAGY